MNKKLLILLVLFFNFYLSHAQCTYTGTPLTSVGTYTFSSCVGTPITTANINAGQYALVNVLAGSTYRFSLGNNFSDNENLTILDATTNNGLAGAFVSNGNGAILNWVSPSTGQIKVFVSRGSCVNDNTSNTAGPITMFEVIRGNATDNQAAFGLDQWVGHVYSCSPGVSPGGLPSPDPASTTTTPFITANYEGYYIIPSEIISTNFGGNTACLPITSKGAAGTTVYTESFAVRYRMRSSRPAGCYAMNVNGDDGVRVYINGVLVFDRWVDQSNTTYCNNLVNLNTNSEIVVDYYENAGQNTLGFSLTPFDGTGNNISSAQNVTICSNTATTLVGSNLLSCNPSPFPKTVYQWQSSTDNINFNNISGATGQNYTAPAVIVAAGNPNNVRYYRRVFKLSTLTAGTCEFFTAVVTVTTSGSVPSQPAAISGNSSVCANTPNQSYSVPVVTNATSYNWTVPSGWIVTAGLGTNSITVTSSTAGGNIGVTATNGCGTSANRNYAITIVTPTATQLNNVIGGFSGNILCVGGAPLLTFDANNDSANVFPFTITYKNNASPTLYTQTILNDSEQIFTPGDNPSSYAAYTLISIANSNCVRTTGFGDSTAEISFRPIPTATISGTTTVCKDSTMPLITFANPQTAAVVVTYNINGGSNTTVSIAASSTETVAAPTATAGTFIYNLVSVVYNSPSICSNSISGSATVTVTAIDTPVLDSKIEIDCVASTGSVILKNLPATGTYTLNRTGTSSSTANGLSGTMQTISGLSAGTYNFSISRAGCTSQELSGVVIQNNASTTTTDGSTWTNGLPTSGKAVIYNLTGAIALSTNIEACRLVVNSGSLTFNSGFTLKVTNEVTVATGAVLAFENDASLVQINNVTNSGNISYKRLTSPIRTTDYTYWSSPVSGFTLGLLSPRTQSDKFYSYQVTAGAEDWKLESAATVMAVGKGYIARGPQTTNGTIPWPLGAYPATFVGVPNNGDISMAGVFANKSYLLGNPYPSALDANTFLTSNAGVLDGTLYFWTHYTPIGVGVSNPGTGYFAYSKDDYASYNLTGGTATAAASDPDKSSTNPNIPNGKIAAGQAFFATSKVSLTGNPIVYNNNMRVGFGSITGTNSQFFRTTKNSKSAAAIEQNRVWLNLFNVQGAFKQTLVGYVTGASNNYEDGFDGKTFDANEFLDFYSVLGSQNLVIQGRALPFDDNDEVQLGFRAAAATSFNIGIDQTDGLLKDQNIFLEDKVLKVVHDLKIAPYSFTTSAGTFNDRFVLRFSQRTLGLDDTTLLGNSIVITTDKNEFKVKSEAENISRITVYDLLGKKVYSKENVDSNQVRISKDVINNQVVIVHVVLADGRVVSKKAL